MNFIFEYFVFNHSLPLLADHSPFASIFPSSTSLFYYKKATKCKADNSPSSWFNSIWLLANSLFAWFMVKYGMFKSAQQKFKSILAIRVGIRFVIGTVDYYSYEDRCTNMLAFGCPFHRTIYLVLLKAQRQLWEAYWPKWTLDKKSVITEWLNIIKLPREKQSCQQMKSLGNHCA